MEVITVLQARRLALARAGLMKPRWTGFPESSAGRGPNARNAAHRIIDKLGYLQLDTVAVAGARSHAIVLLSRQEGFDANLAENLLQPGQPLFEYWGHEACWMPMALYPLFAFRRKAYRHHPWWGDVTGQHPKITRRLMETIRKNGPLKSADIKGPANKGWWDLSVAKRVASALWSGGRLAVRERRNFQRTYDLPERVIPKAFLETVVPDKQAFEELILLALGSHGWATTGTLAQTWRLSGHKTLLASALNCLCAKGRIIACALRTDHHRTITGWIRPRDLELAQRLARCRPRRDTGVLLSPFDPVLWDRKRVQLLFGFEQVLEIFKPAAKRKYGYYCLPVLAGDRLVARVDVKADKRAGTLAVLSLHREAPCSAGETTAVKWALRRYADNLGLTLAAQSL